MDNKVYKAKQLRRALQLWAETITDESIMMEIADVYPKWDGDTKSYKTGDIIAYGTNENGETQLYLALNNHVSQSDWTPDVTPSLYKKVGFSESGLPIWTQPIASDDAYQTGDKVEHNGEVWQSTLDNNVWEPGVHGWVTV